MTRTILVCLCFFYLSTSLLIGMHVPTFENRLEQDSRRYVAKADLFIKHGSFEKPGITHATDFSGIGYPLFLAATFFTKKIFSPTIHPDASTNEKYNLALLIQLLLGMCLLLLSFRLGSLFFSNTAGLVAAALAACNIGLLTYPHYLLTEVLIATLLIFAFERFATFFYTKNYFHLGTSGFIFGCSLVVKAAAWYYVGFLLLVLVWFCRQQKVSYVKNVACFLLLFLIPLGSYMYYNKRMYNYWFFKAVDKVNLYTYFLPKLIASSDEISLDQARYIVKKKLSVTEYATGKGWEKAHEMLVTYLRSHPSKAIRIATFNVLKTFFGLYSTHLKMLFTRCRTILYEQRSFFKSKRTMLSAAKTYVHRYADNWLLKSICWYEVGYILLVTLLTLLAGLALLSRCSFATFVILGSIIAYCALITFPDGGGRLRFIFEIPLLVAAGSSLTLLVRRRWATPPLENIFLK